MWLFLIFMKYPVKAALAHRVSATEKDVPELEEKLTIYCHVVFYPLFTNATDDFGANAEAEITNSKQLKAISTVRYLKLLLEKALCYGRV